jgi:hypothetical protein
MYCIMHCKLLLHSMHLCKLHCKLSHPRQKQFLESVPTTERPTVSTVIPVLYVCTTAQTVRYTHGLLWLQIYAIRITLYQFSNPYNGFFTGFLRFLAKFENQFSQERVLRSPNLKLISSNDSGGYKRLLFWSYGFWFENFGTPPNYRTHVCI